MYNENENNRQNYNPQNGNNEQNYYNSEQYNQNQYNDQQNYDQNFNQQNYNYDDSYNQQNYNSGQTPPPQPPKKKVSVLTALAIAAVIVGVYLLYQNTQNNDDEAEIPDAAPITLIQEIEVSARPEREEVVQEEESERPEREETPQPIETAKPVEINHALEESVSAISDYVTAVGSDIGSANLDAYNPQDDVTSYFDGNALVAIFVKDGVDGIWYNREYYYYDNSLIYAHFENGPEHKFYFDSGDMVRWSYKEDGKNTWINLDSEPTEEYFDWAEAVLSESSQLKNLPIVKADPITMGNISNVSASSTLDEPAAGITHYVSRLVDGDLGTAWVEGVYGNGKGETITFTLNKECLISGINIWAGYHRTSSIYYKNSRPSDITVSFSDGTSQYIELRDTISVQTFYFDSPVQASSIKITLGAAYGGTIYEDNCITEVSFF